jgi:glutathione reductase (NADPH)
LEPELTESADALFHNQVMYNVAALAESIHHAREVGFDLPKHAPLDFTRVKRERDAYVSHLNNVYRENLKKEGVEFIQGWAKFVGPKEVQVDSNVYTAEKILIATGMPSPVFAGLFAS